MNDQNIVLCGFMGAGKTVVGKQLSEKLHMTFCDMDEFIQNKQNLSISEIFDKFGEDYFRELEYQTVCELAKKSEFIIATGGGVMTFPRNSTLFAKKDLLIFLDLPFEVCYSRIKNSARPIVKQNSVEYLRKLYEFRNPIYRQVCPFHLDADRPKFEIVNELVQIYQSTSYVT